MCKKPGHEAGFRGATYIDCPMKPCFLCKMPGNLCWKDCIFPKILCFCLNLLVMFDKMICLMIIFIEGHTTMLCPHRVATEFGVSPAPFKSSHSSLEYVFERQLRCRVPAVMLFYCLSSMYLRFYHLIW